LFGIVFNELRVKITYQVVVVIKLMTVKYGHYTNKVRY